jgi:aminoglycoside phosphotransferase (APT) family kinase protein
VTTVAGGARVSRPPWAEVPAEVRAAVQDRLGVPVSRALTASGGFTLGLASRLRLADGRRVFVKGLPATHALAGTYRTEAAVLAALPERAPAPRLLHVLDGEWIVLVLQDVDGMQPNLRPGSADLVAALAALGSAARTLTPCPVPAVPGVLDDLGPLLRGWTSLAAATPEDLDPWARRHLDSLVVMETGWQPWAAGDTLLHGDVRPDNMIRRVGDGRTVVVDWAYPSRGAAWLDTAALVPQLVIAGHPPADAERLVLGRPVLAGVPGWAVTGFAAALAGRWELSSRLPEPHGSCGLRAYQGAVAAAARAWLAHRTRWS